MWEKAVSSYGTYKRNGYQARPLIFRGVVLPDQERGERGKKRRLPWGEENVNSALNARGISRSATRVKNLAATPVGKKRTGYEKRRREKTTDETKKGGKGKNDT